MTVHIRMTCDDDHREHIMVDDQVLVQQADYLAVCGHRVRPVPMTTPFGRPCQACARQVMVASRPSWVARVFGRPKPQ